MSETVIRDITPQQAAFLRSQGLPDGVEILERDEMLYWGNVYSRPQGGCLYVPEDLDPIERYIPQPQKKTIIACDLFAGAGGFSLGMESAGVDVVCAVEMSKYASWTYLVNLGRRDTNLVFDTEDRRREFFKKPRRRSTSTYPPQDHPTEDDTSWMGCAYRASKGKTDPDVLDQGVRGFYHGDITQVSGQYLLEIAGVDHFDVIFGGPPCQGMSTSNPNRAVDDPRNAMLFEFMRIVTEIKPKMFIIENVPPLLTFGDGILFKRVVAIANEAGYNVAANILDASQYGVPQYRRRALVVGSTDGMYQFPMPSHWGYTSQVSGAEYNTLFDEYEEAEQKHSRKKASRSRQQHQSTLFDQEVQ